MRFDIRVFFGKPSRKFKVRSNRTRITDTLQEDQYTFLIISRSVLFRRRNISDKSCSENQNKHFLLNKSSPSPLENLSGYKITRKNIVRSDTPQMKIWRMRIACWVPKATQTHLEYVILIAFPVQQWLHAGASMLRYKGPNTL
jgi:hypothetical protein